MAFTRITDPTNNIANLANQPVEPPATLKQKFDQIGEDLKDYTNNVFLPELESTTNGDSGADNVGATPIPGGTANTVQGIMEEINLKTEALLPFPDGSVTNGKLATDVKVGSLSALDDLLLGFKTSVTVAINKVVSWIGDITLLSTTDKTSVVNAINELFNNKLGKTEKAADSELLDGIDSTGYCRDNAVVATITTGFASGWSGTVTAIKNHNNLCETTIIAEKTSDISGYEVFLNLASNIRPTTVSNQAYTLQMQSGLLVDGNNSYVAITTDGNISVSSYGTTTNARKIVIKFMYYTA